MTWIEVVGWIIAGCVVALATVALDEWDRRRRWPDEDDDPWT